jgi:pimeloyl-ACP methyl ester carboxylesterase
MESRFASYDGTRIGYRVLGDGPPLICLPGGPGRVGEYLGDLGGLHTRRRLIIPDTRGTGLSADPADADSFRVDRLVQDVEALRAHLGLDQVDLLAHSAAAALGVLYAAAHPGRIAALILVAPGLPVLGVDGDEAEARAVLARRSGEPWYAGALAAMEKAAVGDRSPEVSRAIEPFYYGRWDGCRPPARHRRHQRAEPGRPRRVLGGRHLRPARDQVRHRQARGAGAAARGRGGRVPDRDRGPPGGGAVPERLGDGAAGRGPLPVGGRPGRVRDHGRLVPGGVAIIRSG